MDPRRAPLVISICAWAGYGCFIEFTSPRTQLYACYWSSDKGLAKILVAIGAQINDIDPIVGAKLMVGGHGKPDKSKEDKPE